MRTELEQIRGKRVLLVASTGGHLTQLVRLAPQLAVSPDSTWVTFDSPQSRSLLRGQSVIHVPYVPPRGARALFTAHERLRKHLPDYEGAVSTGAGTALAVLPDMALAGKPSIYIESVSRVEGPSLTGRLLRRWPGVGLYAQHATWPTAPWRLGPSVLTSYTVSPSHSPEARALKVLVVLGTIRPYRFDRLVEAVLAFISTRQCAVTWQLGSTTREDLPGLVVKELSEQAFRDCVREANLIITHAGVGVALTVLNEGKIPILMAREASLGEHIDDHQRQIRNHLIAAGLAVDASQLLAMPDLIDYVLSHRVVDDSPSASTTSVA